MPRNDKPSGVISSARGLAGSFFKYPFLIKRLIWPWTVDVDERPTASQISRTVGGYPCAATCLWM